MGRLIDAERLKAHYCWWAGGGREMSIDEAKKTFDTIIDVQPTVDAVEVVRCKDCRHFHYNKVYEVDGIPLIMGNLVCDKWGNGCRTAENGWCYLGERREDAKTG